MTCFLRINVARKLLLLESKILMRINNSDASDINNINENKMMLLPLVSDKIHLYQYKMKFLV